MESSEKLVAYSIKVNPADVEALRGLARLEGLRRGTDVSWPALVREAMRWMATHRRSIEA